MSSSATLPMSELLRRPAPARLRGQSGPLAAALESLRDALGQPLTLLDAATGEPQNLQGAALGWDYSRWLPLLEQVARRDAPEIVEHEAPLALLALPLTRLERGGSLIAVGVFLSSVVENEAEIASAARVFGVDASRAFAWAQGAEAWPTRALLRVSAAALDNLLQRSHIEYLEREVNEAVAHARESYAELGLLHRLTRRLALSNDDGQLWGRSAQWLSESVPAQCIAVVPNTGDGAVVAARYGRPAPGVIHGQCPLSAAELAEMVARLGPANRRPLLLNRSHTSALMWAFPTVRELACTPILDGSRIEGWLLALNHTGGPSGGVAEFGSAEIRLLESVSTILGVHRSNAGLFHRQADLFDAAVRALITAIDAKDRYTHGHSERVARVAVCLAEELHLSRGEVNTIYLGGLLHDIGKIGVDDSVLNKPGALTPEEFAQIKQHPQLGYDILHGVRQLDRILPIVLHHHEAWDGSGYPHGLAGAQTPLLARVTAVADAFDAMSSDRPYRRGMPDDKLDSIFREGAGRQWDPQVVAAFFSARARVRAASEAASGEPLPLNPMSWVD
ncbi:MAG TPA: HD-GYP domain-containing protein [Lacipirellulaceae bacterium]|nr:HD-GYP domain-containing protein [Lacipirellulaceae bacterium]